MTFDRVPIVEHALDAALASLPAPASRLAPADPVTPSATLAVSTAIGLFEDMVLSRSLDVAARELKKTNRSFYTIGSAGHEVNAVLGAQLRLTDPAFLHYRSGGLMMARARQLPGSTPAFDALLGIVASSEDPISGGRHKVWGSRALWVPPQTSTIASHLPKATGTAFSLARSRRMGVATDLPSDAIVVASFGDASANHATALAGINTARYAARLGLPCPILFVCEDNGIGISVPTPPGWIAESFGSLPPPALPPGRRRDRRGLGNRRRGDRPRQAHPPAGIPPPPDDPPLGPRGFGRGAGVSHRRGDRRGRGP